MRQEWHVDRHAHKTLASALGWLAQNDVDFCLLDSAPPHPWSHGSMPPDYFHMDWCLGIGIKQAVSIPDSDSWHTKIEKALEQSRLPLMGYWSYDLVKRTLPVSLPKHYDAALPELGYFFEPMWLLYAQGQTIRVLGACPESFRKAIFEDNGFPKQEHNLGLFLEPDVEKAIYMQHVDQLKEEIRAGNVYEINYCIPFRARGKIDDPFSLYRKLRQIAPNPFGAFLKRKKEYMLSASMERYLRTDEARVISQPIKGTAKRAPHPGDDARIARALAEDPKERAENIMIVDLVRNDLSKVCETGSIRVPELCKVYAFSQVHQMISTVEGRLHPEGRLLDLIAASFPMGSMTGAPKERATQLIDAHESFRRGLYSGALGFMTPRTVDFNVVIRSLLYDAEREDIVVPVGSAITIDSDPEREYEECWNKIGFWRRLLQGA